MAKRTQEQREKMKAAQQKRRGHERADKTSQELRATYNTIVLFLVLVPGLFFAYFIKVLFWQSMGTLYLWIIGATFSAITFGILNAFTGDTERSKGVFALTSIAFIAVIVLIGYLSSFDFNWGFIDASWPL